MKEGWQPPEEGAGLRILSVMPDAEVSFTSNAKFNQHKVPFFARIFSGSYTSD